MSDSSPSQLSLVDMSDDDSKGTTLPSAKSVKKIVKSPAKPTGKAKNDPPMLRHYREMKQKYPNHLLLYQVGDFYEVFYDDAETVADALQIRLTARHKDQPNPVPMCGVPIHAIENYLPKLLEQNFSVVVVSQKESGKNTKGMVERHVSRIITPGVRYEGDGLDEKRFNYLAAIQINPRGGGVIWYCDVSTGVLRLQEVETEDAASEFLQRIQPSEILLPSTVDGVSVSKEPWLRQISLTAKELQAVITSRPFIAASLDGSIAKLESIVGDKESLTSLQLSKRPPEALSSLEVLVSYVEEISFDGAISFGHVSVDSESAAVVLDVATRRNLELTQARIDGNRKHSLLYYLDSTKTAMGSRLLSEWILSPIVDLERITERHDAVGELVDNPESSAELRSLLASVRDLDRITSRITSGRAVPRDVSMMRDSLRQIPLIKSHLATSPSRLLANLNAQIDALEDVASRLEQSLVDEPPVKINEGGIFKEGFNAEIDRLRSIRSDGRKWLLELETREKEKTGIGGLKVRYNNVFGYFIEVTKANIAKVPDYYERKQTLTNAERFIVKELKEFEVELLSSKAKQFDLEKDLFLELRRWLSEQALRVQKTAYSLGVLDVLCAYGHSARQFNFVRPSFSNSGDLLITGGRHPVIERVIGPHNFVANDCSLSADRRQFAVLTGPNMGGKSTYLRQIGLIQLMAQAGCFVPAAEANLPIVDRIFTRIGAADDLTRGDSTFMVEMREAATILRKATSRSLVLIDEIGRGTATSDGLAIATAIAEWLYKEVKAKCIFATHFHELISLASTNDGVFCLSVGVVETENELRFTHRIEEKAVNKSYGIEVARLAGLPEPLLERAEEILALEEENPVLLSNASTATDETENDSRSAKSERLESRLIQRLEKTVVDETTPLQALSILQELKRLSN